MPPKRKKTQKNPNSKKRRVIPKTRESFKQKIVRSKQEFACDVCEKTFPLISAFKKHKNVCKESQLMLKCETKFERSIRCDECTKVFKFKRSFIRHCILEHAQGPDSVKCGLCHVRCPDQITLYKHIQKIHNRIEYECPHCKKTFARASHVLRHLTQSGCDGQESAVFPCEICQKTFSRKDNLIVHLRYQHIIQKAFPCKQCSFSSKNFSKLVKHWQDTHLGNQKYECDICGSTTSSRTSMAKHLEIHGEKKHVCDVCGYRTFTMEVMKRHVLTHVEEKPFKCQVCGLSYIQRLQLMRHLEKHTENTCVECGLSFNSKARLIIHERTHMGLERLVCPFEDCVYANKDFISEAALRNHLKIHLCKKEVKCEVCGKAFHSEINMRRHLTVHRLDRPRRCMYCVSARAYIRGEQLLRHVRRHHPDVFRQHLWHVRSVMGTDIKVDRVSKSELESILNVLDAESDRILEGYSGADVLYGGMQDQEQRPPDKDTPIKLEEKPLMSEEELVESLSKLLSQLIDKETLECFGWPEESVDDVLEKVVEQCGARGADRARWGRVQCLRENTKNLFLFAVEDKHVARMLDTHTIDQVVKHILAQVDDPDDE